MCKVVAAFDLMSSASGPGVTWFSETGGHLERLAGGDCYLQAAWYLVLCTCLEARKTCLL
jgi:hypothetical protein